MLEFLKIAGRIACLLFCLTLRGHCFSALDSNSNFTFVPLIQGEPAYKYEPAGIPITCSTFDDRCIHDLACEYQSEPGLVGFAVQIGNGTDDTQGERPVLTGMFSSNKTFCDGGLKFPFDPELLAVSLTTYGSWFQIEYPFRAKPCSSPLDCESASLWVSQKTGWTVLVPPCSKMTHAQCRNAENIPEQSV